MSQRPAFYPEVDANPNFPALEERVLARWKKDNVFVKSVEEHPAKKDGRSNEFVFYDGPPFANGLPHYGHILTSYVKDLFARYKTMQGLRVERRFGWDCHGLPAEIGAEKELGISGRQAILKYGVGKFNDYCRTSVMKYTHEWEYYVTRQSRWVDFKNDYKTMDKTYMESVLWAFSELHKNGFIYEAYRVMPYSWAAETPLSNQETKLDNSYRERVDKAVTVSFELNIKEFEKKFNIPGAQGKGVIKSYKALAWTTTPWTLPSNLALAANKEIDYLFVQYKQEWLILSASATQRFFGEALAAGDAEIVATVGGSDLIGLTYTPLFPYFAKHPNSFRILDGTGFVTDSDGTGIVHMAPGFGEEDQRVCEAAGISLVCPVDIAGRFTDEIYDIDYDTGLPPADARLPLREEAEASIRAGNIFSLKGMNVLEENIAEYKFGEANERIVEWLKRHGHLIKQEQITHNYPHCWRTDKPLIYRAMSSWYVEVTKYRDRMVELNRQINWIPEHVRDGLFGKWLENARDWSISRNRFWGTPIPVWRSKSGKVKVFGSIAEIENASGQTVLDLHRPAIDDIVINDGAEQYTRVEDVFDCWFESGSMPYAQVHYPFENQAWFETHSPADFITEYVAQTRGWFYNMMALHAGVFYNHPVLSKNPPFKNCICHGVVLDDKGQKLSKRLNNFADPKEIFDRFGADALRWFMMSSPVMRGLELYIDKEGKFIRDVVRLAIKPIWNAYNFFCLYANADGIKAKFRVDSGLGTMMDRYILNKCQRAVEIITTALDAYDTPSATEAIAEFFEALNNWYIRRTKERFWRKAVDEDKQAAYDTLYTVLHVMCRAAAPLLPLTLEEIYCGLTGEPSVHLTEFPTLRGWMSDDGLIEMMDTTRNICNAALGVRNAQNLRVRLPLASLTIVSAERKYDGAFVERIGIIRDEVNVKEVIFKSDVAHYATFKIQIHFPVLGKRIPEKIKQIIPAAKKGHWKKLADGRVEVSGEMLEKNEFTLQLEPKPEYKDKAQALPGNDALIILDTQITEELQAEGYARDLIRLIQQARKDAGLHVTDRIHLRLRVSNTLKEALHSHMDYIASQVLAASLVEGDMQGCTFIVNETIESEEVSIGFTSKAAAA